MTIEELYNAMVKKEKIYILRAVGYYPKASYEIYEVEILGIKTYNVEDSMDAIGTYIDLDFRLSCGTEDSECFYIDRLHKDKESAEIVRKKLQNDYIKTFRGRALSEIKQLMKEFEIGIEELKEEK